MFSHHGNLTFVERCYEYNFANSIGKPRFFIGIYLCLSEMHYLSLANQAITTRSQMSVFE